MTRVPTPLRRPLMAGLIVPTAAAAAAASAQPAATTPAPADFAVCSACHESTPKAPPSVGPNLFGVGGRKAGSAPDFDYSDAMKNSTTVWSADTLSAFVLDPAKTISATRWTTAEQRRDAKAGQGDRRLSDEPERLRASGADASSASSLNFCDPTDPSRLHFQAIRSLS